MAKTRPVREDFDPRRDFVAIRSFKVAGNAVQPGDPFNKNWTSTRRLRQLCEQHSIRMAPAGPIKKARGRRRLARASERSVAPVLDVQVGNQTIPSNLEALTDQELRKFLTAKGVIPRPKATREQLVARASKVVTEALWPT